MSRRQPRDLELLDTLDALERQPDDLELVDSSRIDWRKWDRRRRGEA